MSMLPANLRFTVLVSWPIAVGTVVVIALDDGLAAISHTLAHLQLQWLALALGFELLAYAGYVAAYRSTAHAPEATTASAATRRATRDCRLWTVCGPGALLARSARAARGAPQRS